MKSKDLFKRFVAHVLSILMIMSTVGAGLTALGVIQPEAVNADSVTEISVGDHITMGDADAEGYTGIPYWRVLDKDEDGNYFLMSEYLWRGTDLSAYMSFQNGADMQSAQAKGNKWQGSDAQQWCEDFRTDVLGDVGDLGVSILKQTKSDEAFTSPDSTTVKYAASENILNEDEVFFLSAEEVAQYMPKNGTDKTARKANLPNDEGKSIDMWFLRSAFLNTSTGATTYVGNVNAGGSIDRVSVYGGTRYGMRPAMWVSFSDDACLSYEENGDTKDWTLSAPEEAAKPDLVVDLDEDNISADGGDIVWVVYGNEEIDDIEEVVASEDFTVQLDEGSGFADYTGDVEAEFESTDYEEGTVTVTVPENESNTEKKWRLKYSGEFYVNTGQNVVKGDCPYCTQAAAEPVVEPEITKISFDKTEYKAGDAAFTVSLEGTDLDKLDATNFKLEFYEYGWSAYNYPVAPITFTAGADGTTATVTFEVSASNEKYRFTAIEHVASSVSNNPQELTLKKAVYTKVSVDPAELTSAGGDAVFTVTGTGLDLASASGFKLFKPYTDEYGTYDTDSGLTPTLTPNTDGTSLSVKFALPANETDADLTYSLRVVKPGSSQWNPSYYTDTELSGARSTVTVKAPEVTAKPDIHVHADNNAVVSEYGGTCSWGIWSYDGSDVVGVLSASDFTVQKDTGDGPADYSDIEVTFEDGTNDDEATVSFTAPANDGQTEVKWSLKYVGAVVDDHGSAAAWPVVTQPVKDPAVEDVAATIAALPAADAVTAENREAIEAARAAYDALSDEQKAKVDASKLEAAEGALKAIDDQAAADEVKTMIDALPAAGNVTTADKAKIEAARAAYDALTADQKAKIDDDTLSKLTSAETALDEAQKAADKTTPEDKSKSVTSVTIPSGTVSAASIRSAIAAAGGNTNYVTEIVLGKGVKKISKNAFKGTKITTIVVQTKKLKKKSVKGSLKGSKVKTVKVKIGSKKVNKKYVKKYKKIFTKKNAGKKAKVK